MRGRATTSADLLGVIPEGGMGKVAAWGVANF
jgi:hypothetical protein